VIGAGSWAQPSPPACQRRPGDHSPRHCSSTALRRRQEKGPYPESKAFRNKLAANGVQGALNPNRLLLRAENFKLITIGNMEDDLKSLKRCSGSLRSWWKGSTSRRLYSKTRIRHDPGTLITSNTSGFLPRPCWKAARRISESTLPSPISSTLRDI